EQSFHLNRYSERQIAVGAPGNDRPRTDSGICQGIMVKSSRQHRTPGPILTDIGWGGRNRTFAWRNQNPLPYRLATPHHRCAKAATGSGGTILGASEARNLRVTVEGGSLERVIWRLVVHCDSARTS